MADPFPWDNLLELIATDQRTAPIVGPELSVLPAQGGIPLGRHAAQQLAAQFGVAGEFASLTQLAAAFRREGRNPAQLTRALSRFHRESIASLDASTLPEPLRQIADIRDFPLILTTAPDSLLASAIRIARERDAGPLVASLGGDTDLPRNWMQGPRPTLFHLFGRINAVPDFALTDEDVIEFLHRLQSDALRPAQLIDELRSRHLLLIGLGLPGCVLRIFLRILHGARLSEDTGQTLVVAGDTIARDAEFTTFVRETGRRVWIYEEGGAAGFVRELHKRWHASQEEGWSTTTDGRAIPAEPAEMTPGAIYLSAARADRTAAERLAALLDQAGLDVWFDRNDAPGGPRYERRIRQHIQQCDLFLPLLSPATGSQADAFFRKEWNWAIERRDTHRRFIQPVWIGEEPAPGTAPAPLDRFPLLAAHAGQHTPQLVRECVEAVRQARLQRIC